MLKRCTDPNSEDWQYYGAQGVEVRFPNFEAFLAHAGEAPPGKSIDRWPDKNGHYEPGNVRWATPKEQTDNRRSRKNGLTLEQARTIRADPRRPYRVIAKDYGISASMVCMIMRGHKWADV